MFAPPFPKNMDLLHKNNTSLAHFVASFKELTIFRQTASDAVFLPPGIIHATFTVKPGLLYGCNFRTRKNSYGATIGLLNAMIENIVSENYTERDEIIETWVEMMEDIAVNERHNDKQKAEQAILLRGLKRCRRSDKFGSKSELVEEMIERHFPKAVSKERAHESKLKAKEK